MKKIEVFRVMETSYEDGSYWIEYMVNGAWGYEIVYGIDKLKRTVSDDEIIEKIKSDYSDNDVIERLINSKSAIEEEAILENARRYYENLFNTDVELNKKVTSKPYLSVCGDDLKDYIEECRQSENEMWYITSEDLEEEFGDNQEAKDNYIKKIQEEVEKLGVNEYIEFYQDDYDVVVFYGGIITQFLFGEENTDSHIELKITENREGNRGAEITIYENDYYTVKKVVGVNDYIDVVITAKDKIDNYIHDIYIEENSDTFEITGFEIQTTSYGALKTEEIEKVVEGYNIAIKTVKELEKIFL